MRCSFLLLLKAIVVEYLQRLEVGIALGTGGAKSSICLASSKQMSNQVGNYWLGLKVENVSHGAWDMNGTWTTWSHGVQAWWNSPRGTVFHIEGLVGVVTLSMLFLATFGSLRRRSRSFLAQKAVLAAYLSSSLVSYTLGSMQSSPVKSSMYPFWAVSLYILSGSTDSITAYSLDDNSRQMEQMYQTFLCMFYVGLIAVTIINNGFGILLFFDMGGLACLKWLYRLWACRMASGSWNLNKMVADYMYQEHNRSGGAYDPASMKGYHYIVDCPLHMSKLEAGTSYATQLVTSDDDEADDEDAHQQAIIDLEKIWQCEGLSSEEKDACLSFSLFHLLRRRFFGFECAESPLPKTHDFVFKGLLARNEGSAINYNRVFKVIEVELAFMYDFFFTKYAAVYYGQQSTSTVFGWCLLVFAFLLGIMAVSPHWTFFHVHVRNWSPIANPTTADVAVTLLLLSCIALLELLHMLLYWTTIWGRVYLACYSVRGQAEQDLTDTRIRDPAFKILTSNELEESFLIKVCMHISNGYWYWFPQKDKCFWQNKLGQYSLLESVRYNPKASKVLLALFKQKIMFYPFRPPMNRRLFGVKWTAGNRKAREPIELSTEVREALVQSLERTQGNLTNGQSSLMYNGAGDLLWACRHDNKHQGTNCSQRKENQAQFILTWHIATYNCEMAPRVGGGGALKHHIHIATKLSKYCAYLLLREPKLLPGHHYDTTRVLGAVIGEVAGFLESEQQQEVKYEAIARFAESLSETPPASLSEANEKIFHNGLRLGKQLEGMEEGVRWKVLADFWAEMLLYLTPSDNVKEHIECLAKGGELITHLWALLTHAGILRRAERNAVANDIENAGTNHVQSEGRMGQQGANLVQNVGGAPNARPAPSEVNEIEQ